MKKKKIAVVGAGLVGSLLAAILAREGLNVAVYERRPDMRKVDAGGGRSINLALSDRGWRALEIAGVADEVRKMGIPMYGRMIHNEDGSQVFQPYGKENQAIYSVSRGGLNEVLMTHAEKQGVEIHFDKRCKNVDLQNNVIQFKDGEAANYDMIFGADGAFSMVRLSMQMTDRFDYQQFYLEHGYKELSIPAGETEKWQIEKNALHIWPRHSFMLIALPNMDGSFTCTLFAPFEGKNGFNQVQSEGDLEQYFQTYFPDAFKLMPTLKEDYFTNPTSSLVTVKCHPWVHEEDVVLIGDAAHAIVPFYGQGMNAGFEDCSVLHSLLQQHGDWNGVLQEYQKERKPNGDAIADLAIQNFVEMRDLVADPQFLFRKKVEKALHQQLGDQFMPVYSMVTFSHQPYAKALEQSEKQEKFFSSEVAGKISEEELNDDILNKLSRIWLRKYY